MRLVFDCEANGLLPTVTKVWCIVLKDIDTGTKYVCHDDFFGSEMYFKSMYSLRDGVSLLEKADEIIGHNIIDYDIPLLEKFFDLRLKDSVVITDTLVISRVLNPDRESPIGIKGGHSLDAWGKRVGRYKPGHDDWTKISKKMLHRCEEDVEINHLVLQELQAEMGDYDWTEALDMEHKVAHIISKQARDGVYFDTAAAYRLLTELDGKIASIDERLVPILPKTVKQRGQEVRKPFKISGEYTKMVCDWFTCDITTRHGNAGEVAGPFSRVEFFDFNLNSDKQVKDYLLDNGWVPTEWNFVKDKEYKTGYRRTSPKLTEDSYASIAGDMPAMIKERLVLKHRRSTLKSLKGDKKGWLNTVREDGCLSASANPCGTNTARMRHSGVVNVPSHGLYGTEMRSLFIPRPHRVFVGHDAEQLELRILAHYMNDEGYINAILSGDIHTFNQHLAGLPTRDGAKTFIYAFIYGGGDLKLGQIVGGGKVEGAGLRRQFLSSIPVLDVLTTRVKRKAGQGYLKGLDGRKVFMRRGDDGRILRHKALNTLLQSAGAIVMKRSIVLLDQWVREEGLDSIKVIDMHDEGQYDVAVKDVERHMELAALSIVKAGEYYDLNIPLAADVMQGRNWSETH